MNDFIQTVSAREWAALFWFSVFVLSVAGHKKTSGSFFDVLDAFFKLVIVLPLLIGALYGAVEIYLLKQIGLWSVANLKTTILWLLTFSFVNMLALVSKNGRKNGVHSVFRDIISVTAILTFISELHSFPFLIELLLLPFVTFVVVLAEVAKLRPEHASTAKVLGGCGALIGFGYLGFSVWKTIEGWQETATRETFFEFVVPIILSLGFLPFLFLWRIYIAYSQMFSTLANAGLDKTLIPYARWLAVARIGGDLEFLERWRQAIQIARPATVHELRHSLVALRALKAREMSPPTIKPEDGWSPYLAMQFMADLSYDTGHYHNSFDEEWYAASPMREIGDGAIFKNNVAYYVEGNEHAATTLKLKLNINDPENSQEAEDWFIISCLQLLEQAVSIDAVEQSKLKIASLEPFNANIPFGQICVEKDEWVGGIKDGYSRKFTIARGRSLGSVKP